MFSFHAVSVNLRHCTASYLEGLVPLIKFIPPAVNSNQESRWNSSLVWGIAYLLHNSTSVVLFVLLLFTIVAYFIEFHMMIVVREWHSSQWFRRKSETPFRQVIITYPIRYTFKLNAVAWNTVNIPTVSIYTRLFRAYQEPPVSTFNYMPVKLE